MIVGLVAGFLIGGIALWLFMVSRAHSREKDWSEKAESLTAAARKASAEASRLRMDLTELERQMKEGQDLILLFPDLIKMIFSGKDSDEVVDYINRSCQNLLKANESAVFLADRSGARLGLSASTGLSDVLGQTVNIGLGEGFTGLAAETGRLLDRSEMEQESVLVRRNMIMTDIPGFKPEYAAPMQSEGLLFGVITVGAFEGRGAMRKETLRALAAVGAAALENVRLLERFGRTSDLDPETGFSGKTSLESTLENELERVERFGSPMAVIELVIKSAEADDSLVSREILSAASRHLRSSLRNIDIGVRTGRGSIMLLLPGTDENGLDSVTGKLGGEIPLIKVDSGSTVGTVSIRGCVVEGNKRLSSMELLDMLKMKESMDFDGYYEV